MIRVCIILLIVSSIIIVVVRGQQQDSDKKKKDYYCSACKLMIDSISSQLLEVDPNERIQVGSYRVDGNGHQKLREVPLSETKYHIENIVENVCSKFIENSNGKIPHGLRNVYEHACDDLLEENHDNLIEQFGKKEFEQSTDNRLLTENFCIEVTRFCTPEQLTEVFNQKFEIPVVPEVEEDEKIETESDTDADTNANANANSGEEKDEL